MVALFTLAAGCGKKEHASDPALKAACAAFKLDDARCQSLSADKTFVAQAVYLHLLNLASGDAGGACSLYTDQLRRDTAQLVDGSRSCAQTLRRVKVVASPDAVSQAADTAKISINGHSATVRFATSANRDLARAAGGLLTLHQSGTITWLIARVQDASRGGALP
jgi:hypothetical protein